MATPRARSTAGVVATVVALLLALLPGVGVTQEDRRIGDDPDPVVGSVLISRATHADGAASHAIIGRADAFADNLAATALAGRFGTMLLTTGGTDAPIRPEVLDELQRALGPADCQPGDPPSVYLAGGVAAVSAQVEQAVAEAGYCTLRLGGDTRIQTAIRIGDQTGMPSGTAVLARADDWADAAAIGAWAALTNSRILLTPADALDPDVADTLRRWAPAEILLVGGTAALSQAVADAAGQIAPTRRVAGAARDRTATAIATEVWGDAAGGGYVLGHGYAGTAWAYLLAVAPLAARQGRPILYATDDGPTEASQALLGASPDVIPVGPAVPPDTPPDGEPTPEPTSGPVPPTDLDGARVALEEVGVFSAPLAMAARPGRAELWIAERAGRVRVLGDGRTVLDISDTVSTNGERGLLGMAFSTDGARLFTSSTDLGGTSVVDVFDIVAGPDGDIVDEGSRRQIIAVAQPASNHNGGDLHIGPDGYLWWSLGDGGGSNDEFGHGQRPDTLLATLVRIDPDGGQPYAIPPDNPFADGRAGAPEVWAFGLRNPFRFSFDPATGDLYIADVGQGAVEEVDVLPAGTGAGSNFGWSVFEGDRPFSGSSLDGHVPPVWTTTHSAGNCSITGGVVYRGGAIPELHGGYLYSDLCNSMIRSILVEGGAVTQDADLGVRVGSPVGFGVDHDGEVYVLSLGGPVYKIVPA